MSIRQRKPQSMNHRSSSASDNTHESSQLLSPSSQPHAEMSRLLSSSPTRSSRFLAPSDNNLYTHENSHPNLTKSSDPSFSSVKLPPPRDSLYYAYGKSNAKVPSSIEVNDFTHNESVSHSDLPPLGSRDAVLFADQDMETNLSSTMLLPESSSRITPATPFGVNLTPIRHLTESPHPSVSRHTHHTNQKQSQDFYGHSILVFGFPPGESSLILSRFQKYGEIVEHRIGAGNWLKIEYSTKLGAQQAMQQNGNVVSGSFMIGVKPCAPDFEPQMDVTRGSMYTKKRVQNSNYGGLGRPAEIEPPHQYDDNVCTKIITWLTSW